MQMFSRSSLFTLVFLGLSLLLFGHTVNVYAQDSTLEIGGKISPSQIYQVGDSVIATFVADVDSHPISVELSIIGSIGLTGLPSTVTASPTSGRVTVKAEITNDVYNLPLKAGYHEVTISARWEEKK